MRTANRYFLSFFIIASLVLTILLISTHFTNADTLIAESAPSVMNYQGFLTDDSDQPYTGLADFTFGIFTAETGGSPIWSEPQNNVTVSNGYFSVLLGSINPLSAVDFAGATRYLGVTVDIGAGSVSLPRQRLGTVPYALQAQVASSAPWSGLSGIPAGFADDIDGVEFENVLIVAKSGGQFTSIQAAINSIGDASGTNRYLVWVGPGEYNEHVVLKDYIYLVGAGQGLTLISDDTQNISDLYPPEQATLHLASYSGVSELTVINEGGGYRNVAILGDSSSDVVKLIHVTAIAQGHGDLNYGIFLHGESTKTELIDVTSEARDSTDSAIGLENAISSTVILEGGNFIAQNSGSSVGIVNTSGGYIRADSTNAEAHNGESDSIAFFNMFRGVDSTDAELIGGRFLATNGYTVTYGIRNTGGYLEAHHVFVQASDGPNYVMGLENKAGTARLYGGSFTARGGMESFGIGNYLTSYLESTSVNVVANNGVIYNYGFRNLGGSHAQLTGGVFRAWGGDDNRGVANFDLNSLIDLKQVFVQGEDGDTAYGVSNELDGKAYVSNSDINGATNSFLADGAVNHIYLSHLTGGGVGGTGDITCVGITFGGTFLADSCP